MKIELDKMGLDESTVKFLLQIRHDLTPREAVVLKLAAAMANEGEVSGAKWLVGKVVLNRTKAGGGW